MGEILAYFLTWTTYGTWLPGDRRGWVDRSRTHGEIREPPDFARREGAEYLLKEDAVHLTSTMRETAHQAMIDTARYRQWYVHALQVRTNHVHVIITARKASKVQVLKALKNYASRALNREAGRRLRWWTRNGSKRNIYSESDLWAAIRYVRGQDQSWRRHR